MLERRCKDHSAGLHNLVLTLHIRFQDVVGDQLPFSLAGQQIVENGFAALRIGCERDLVDIAKSSKGFDVGVMRVCRQGVSKEDDAADVSG